MRRLALVLALVTILAACGDNPAAPAPDAGPPDAMPYRPSPHPALPQAATFGGPVMAHPKIVPIWFTGDDAFQAANDDFLAKFAATDDWAQMVAEYGVGPLTIEPDIVATDAPPQTEDQLEAWLVSMSDGTHAGWPTPDDDTLYAVFLPLGAVLTGGTGTSCTDYQGYHFETLPSQGKQLIYALLPRCGRGSDFIDTLTGAEVHEYVEATTDPRFETQPAFRSIDAVHAINRDVPGAELGDMCEDIGGAYARIVGTYQLQRTWSNAAAAADHDPCVPRPSTPYVAATPVLADNVTVQTSEGPVAAKGVLLAVGATKTIELDLWSDAPSGPFQVAVTGSPELTLSLDKNSGVDGDKLALTIQSTGAGSFIGGSIVRISTLVGQNEVGEAWIFVSN